VVVDDENCLTHKPIVADESPLRSTENRTIRTNICS
jgi:hypothetical protein